MNKFLKIICAYILWNYFPPVNSVVPPTNTIELQCKEGWSLNDVYCYKVYHQSMSWAQALKICRSDGGQLAKIQDSLSNKDIGNIAKNAGVGRFWIGFVKDESDSYAKKYINGQQLLSISPTSSQTEWWSAKWSDGQNTTLFSGFWNDGQPDSSHGNCVSLNSDVNNDLQSKWSMQNCEEKNDFICQLPACSKGSFQCSNGNCVSRSLTCDGIDDCEDFSDEYNCSTRCHYYQTGSSGDIRSRNYPNYYSSTDNCTWLIEGPISSNIKLQFTDFSTIQDYDEVLIFVGGKTEVTSEYMGRISGELTPPYPVIVSSNNLMLIKFHSVKLNNGKGFRANWTAVSVHSPEMGTKLIATNETQVLTSPFYPEMLLRNQELVWIITPEHPRSIITLQIIELSLAVDDVLTVRDGQGVNDPVLATFTHSDGHMSKFVLSTTKHGLHILLRTFGKYSGKNYKGFRLTYKEGCAIEVKERYGEIFSPGYGSVNYPNYQNCSWFINLPTEERVTVVFDEDFEVENGHDFLQIYRGVNKTGIIAHPRGTLGFTGNSAPQDVSSSTGKLYINLRTDSITSTKGYHARYSIGCSIPTFNIYTITTPRTPFFDFGLDLNVTCRQGYSFNAEEFLNPDNSSMNYVEMKCLYGGKWNIRRTPQCQAVYCGQPPFLLNGYILNSTGVVYQSTVTYTCLDGFTPDGSTSISCQGDGTWEPIPVCRAVGCTQPKQINFGSYSVVDGNGTDFGSRLIYSCSAGYQIDGEAILFCLPNGSWSHNFPSCQRLHCLVPEIKSGSLNVSSPFVFYQDLVVLLCDTGYEVTGSGGGFVPHTLTCGADQTFGALIPECIDIDECARGDNCSQKEKCTNTDGSYYCTCVSGYYRNASGLCEDIDECAVDNGGCDGICNNTEGSYTCSCSSGYTLYTTNGTEQLYLAPTETGLLAGDLYYINHTCVLVACPPLPELLNGYLMNPKIYYHYGDTVRFHCTLGYVMVGNDSNVCTETGQWRNSFPTCHVAECPVDIPPALINPPTVPLLNSVQYYTFLNFTCNVDGRGQFTRSRQCLYDRDTDTYKLMGDSYECGVIDCGLPENLRNGIMSSFDNSTFGNYFSVSCKDFYDLHGNSSQGDTVVRCLSDGYWDYGNIRCLPMRCPDPGRPLGGNHSNSDYSIGSLIEFSCNRPGFVLSDPYPIECIPNMDSTSLIWNSSVPTCSDETFPVISGCPNENLVIKKYSSAGFVVPSVTDNSGSVYNYTVVPSGFVPSFPVLSNTTVLYTVTDHVGNQRECGTNIRILDESPPVVQCPSSYTAYLNREDETRIISLKSSDFVVSDNVGVDSFTFEPMQINVSMETLNKVYTIKARAVDYEGNSEICNYQIMVKAVSCLPLSLSTPQHTSTNCTAKENSTGYYCEIRCDSGYYFYDSYPNEVLATECTTGGEWTKKYIPSCVASESTNYRQEFELFYETENETIQYSNQCLTSYINILRTRTTGVSDSLTRLCVLLGQTNNFVSIPQEQLSLSYNSQNFSQFGVKYTVTFLPPGLKYNDYCIDLVRRSFTSLTDSIISLKSVTGIIGCPNVTAFTTEIDIDGEECPVNLKSRVYTGNVGGGTKVCLSCPPGSFRNTSGYCELCPLGTFSNAQGSLFCTSCSPWKWTYQMGSTSESDCVETCRDGLQSLTKLPPCSECPANQYRDTADSCVTCPSGSGYIGTEKAFSKTCRRGNCTYTKRTNSANSTPYQSYTGTVEECKRYCENFVIGTGIECTGFTYQRDQSLCKIHYDTPSIISDGRSDYYSRDCNDLLQRECYCYLNCAAGYFSHNGIQQCRQCPKNYYTDQSASTSCIECPSGTITLSAGVASKALCLRASTYLCYQGRCQNGATCQVDNHDYVCQCQPGYTGKNCENIVDYCASQPCYYGNCTNSPDSFTCNCPQGITGTQCESEPNDCFSNPCKNGAICLDGVLDYTCVCLPGFQGKNCDMTASVCDAQPCLNRGVCQSVDNVRRKCACTGGFAGKNCEIDIDECLSAPCLNKGTCVDGIDGYSCNCPQAFTGSRCEIPKMQCSDQICLNAGGCYDDYKTGQPQCVCKPGYTIASTVSSKKANNENSSDSSSDSSDSDESSDDDLDVNLSSDSSDSSSEEDDFNSFRNNSHSDNDTLIGNCTMIDSCSQYSPCKNGGSCHNVEGGYQCSCLLGYSGSQCQHNTDDCASGPCKNGANCTDKLNSYTCDCPQGYTGKQCEDDINECQQGPCDPVGVAYCDNTVGSYRCACKQGYGGNTCSENIDDCLSDPCYHGGSCYDKVNDFRCECTDGWKGKKCETLVDYCTDVSNPCLNSANCVSLFNDYFCRCPVETFGRTCEKLSGLCDRVKPCLNTGSCSVKADRNLTCLCSSGYYGDGCHMLVDYACTSDSCLNSGTCAIKSGGDGYTCSCPQGYRGDRCEENINECEGVTCPGGGMCIDGIGEMFCRCPVGKSGSDCKEGNTEQNCTAVDNNFNACFLSTKKMDSVYIPYAIDVNDRVVSLVFWVKFSINGDSGTFFTMFEQRLQSILQERSEILRLTDRGLYINFDRVERFYSYLYHNINNGQWHFVVINWDSDKGEFSVIVDTIRQIYLQNFNADRHLDKYYWITLGNHYPMWTGQAIVDGGFMGCISQFNIYNRTLGFITEIPQLYSSRQLEGDLLQWVEFKLDGHAIRTRFSLTDTSVQARSSLAVDYCPNDIYDAQANSRLIWKEPVFSIRADIVSNYKPGTLLSEGRYSVAYEADDGKGNKDLCTFKIYVKESNCSSPVSPKGNSNQTCYTEGWPFYACSISCLATSSMSSKKYGLTQPVPKFYTCGPLGTWTESEDDDCDFLYPSCGVLSKEANVVINVRLKYRVSTSVCEAVKIALGLEVTSRLKTLNTQWNGQLCNQSDCTDVSVMVTCQPVAYTSTYINFALTNIPGSLSRSLPSEVLSPSDVITRSVLDLDMFYFGNVVPYGQPDPNGFEVSSEKFCPDGQVLTGDNCVYCGLGMYFESANRTCVTCQKGYYQDSEDGATSCQACPVGTTTRCKGTDSSALCYSKCPVGSYYNLSSSACDTCPVASYQDKTGQFSCHKCPPGKTTRQAGSTSADNCYDECSSGFELNFQGFCEPCDYGFYRSLSDGQICLSCPSGFTTHSTGSTSVTDCSKVACSPGQFHVVKANICKNCPMATYQDEKWQDTCKPCGDNYTTEQTGSSSQSQCKFFCQSGYEILGRTSCEACPVGTYKDNVDGIFSSCQICPRGRTTLGTATDSQSGCSVLICPAGYKADDQNQLCVKCPVGSYQLAENQQSCLPCPAGTTTRVDGADSVNKCEAYCQPGFENTTSGCVPCPVGYYKDNIKDVFGQCVACPVDFVTSNQGSTSKGDCTVRNCSAGYRIKRSRILLAQKCEKCPIGQYQPAKYQSQCLDCPANTSTRQEGTVSLSQCESYCPSGEERQTRAVVTSPCIPCPIGYYKDNGDGVFGPCLQCPVAFITKSTGSTTASDCSVPNCRPGYYHDKDFNLCIPCSIGSYQPQKWQTECLQCPTDTTTSSVGATDIKQCFLSCRPGYEEVSGVCTKCGIGYYKSVTAAGTPCTKCPDGYRTESTGSTDVADCRIADCQPGSFLQDSTNVCRLCPYSQYQPQKWQNSCVSCPSQTTTFRLGAVSQSECLLDCESGYEYNSVAKQCQPCGRGYYRDKGILSQSTCLLCAEQYITPENKLGLSVTDCNIANCSSPGTYRDVATNQCKPCPVGQYQDKKWQDQCTSCPVGYTTQSTGSHIATDCFVDCPSGQEENGGSCIDCSQGKFRNKFVSLKCMDCPIGKTTLGVGSTSQSQCSLASCVEGQYYDGSVCKLCPRGSYQPEKYKTLCLSCPADKLNTLQEGSNSLSQCISYCGDTSLNNCSDHATCEEFSNRYTCTCKTNYKGDGHTCTNICDLVPVHCMNGGTCLRNSQPLCVCDQYYTGDRCQIRLDSREASYQIVETAVGAAIGGLIFILLVGLVIVGIIKYFRRGIEKNKKKRRNKAKMVSRQPSFVGSQVTKASLQGYTNPSLSYPVKDLNSSFIANQMLPDTSFLTVYDNDIYDMSYRGDAYNNGVLTTKDEVTIL